MYKSDLALNDLQCLICYKTKQNQIYSGLYRVLLMKKKSPGRMYVFTKPLRHWQDVTQVQFVREIQLVLIQRFSSNLIAVPRLKRRVCPYYLPIAKGGVENRTYEIIINVFQWTPTYGHTGVGRQPKPYIYRICVDTKCGIEDRFVW